MIRKLTPKTGDANWDLLRLEADAKVPGCRAVNEVEIDGEVYLAAYWPDGTKVSTPTWASVVRKHTPPDEAEADEEGDALHRFVVALVDAVDSAENSVTALKQAILSAAAATLAE